MQEVVIHADETIGTGAATAGILHADDLNAFNSFDHPNQIFPQAHPVSLDGETIQMDLPRLSLVTVSVQLA